MTDVHQCPKRLIPLINLPRGSLPQMLGLVSVGKKHPSPAALLTPSNTHTYTCLSKPLALPTGFSLEVLTSRL